jgi:hypothetical protein
MLPNRSQRRFQRPAGMPFLRFPHPPRIDARPHSSARAMAKVNQGTGGNGHESILDLRFWISDWCENYVSSSR